MSASSACSSVSRYAPRRTPHATAAAQRSRVRSLIAGRHVHGELHQHHRRRLCACPVRMHFPGRPSRSTATHSALATPRSCSLAVTAATVPAGGRHSASAPWLVAFVSGLLVGFLKQCQCPGCSPPREPVSRVSADTQATSPLLALTENPDGRVGGQNHQAANRASCRTFLLSLPPSPPAVPV